VIPETVVKADLFLVLGTGFTAATTKRFDRPSVFTTSRLHDFTTSGALFDGPSPFFLGEWPGQSKLVLTVVFYRFYRILILKVPLISEGNHLSFENSYRNSLNRSEYFVLTYRQGFPLKIKGFTISPRKQPNISCPRS